MKKEKPVILCVDDERFVLDTMSRQLQRQFKDRFDFDFAESAEEAFSIIGDLMKKSNRLVMVITDQIMPGMRGDQFLAKLYEQYPTVVTILLTGQASMESAINLINDANLYRYITKPWDEGDLLLTIEKGIEQFNLSQKALQQYEMFRMFVPQEFLKSLSKTEMLDIKLGDSVESEMTILFSDIRGFTTLAESISPEECFKFINAYLSHVEPAIHENKGFIDKYIGDAVMALFANPEDAVKAAIRFQEKLEEYNVERKKENLPPIETGIGLHTGRCMLGIVGALQHMQCTVVSDAVNLASRIQGLASMYGASVIISQELIDKLPDKNLFAFRSLGKIRVKGKENEVSIYHLIDAEKAENREKKLKTKNTFEEGLALYLSRNFAEASVKFNLVVNEDPDDKAAAYYLRKAANYLLQKPPEDWTGIDCIV